MKGQKYRVIDGTSVTAEDANYLYREVELTRDVAIAVAEALACETCQGMGFVTQELPPGDRGERNYLSTPCLCRDRLRAALKEAGPK